MTAKARWMLVAVIGGLAVAVAGAALAWACTPQAYMDLSGPGSSGGDTNTPSDPGKRPILPGDEVTVTGHLFRATTPSERTTVKLRWGLRGPLIAEIPTDAEGSWSHTFTTAAGLAHGSYVLAAYAPGTPEASEAGIRARLTLTLGPRPAREASDRSGTGPASERPAGTQAPDRSGGKQAPEPADEQPAPVEADKAAGESSAAAPAEADTTPAPARADRARPAPAPPRASRVPQPRVATPGSSPALTATAVPDETPEIAWPLFVLGALGILLVGGAAGGLVVARRWAPRPVDPVGAEPDERRPGADPVEAELQEIIAEQSARAGSEPVAGSEPLSRP